MRGATARPFKGEKVGLSAPSGPASSLSLRQEAQAGIVARLTNDPNLNKKVGGNGREVPRTARMALVVGWARPSRVSHSRFMF